MENKNLKLNTILLAVVIVLLIVVVLFVTKKADAPVTNNSENSAPLVDTKILGNVKDLVSFSVNPGEKVSGILTVTGSVKGGYFFEANILVNILDSNKNILKNGHANATTDWMTTEPVSFEGNIDFTGLPKGPAYIEIHNDNASGLPENDKNILIPIIIE
jgi:hypothetical protein